MNRLADNRTLIQDIDGAREVMREIALISKRIAITNARAEKRIADIKTQADKENEGRRLALAKFTADLSAWITANATQFEKPRTCKTEFGEFGLRTVPELSVSNETETISWLMENGYVDCFETVQKLVKPAISKRLNAKETIPGCLIRTGDTVVCKVSKAIIDAGLQSLEE